MAQRIQMVCSHSLKTLDLKKKKKRLIWEHVKNGNHYSKSYLEICEIRLTKIHSPNHLFAQIFDSYYNIGAKL